MQQPKPACKHYSRSAPATRHKMVETDIRQFTASLRFKPRSTTTFVLFVPFCGSSLFHIEVVKPDVFSLAFLKSTQPQFILAGLENGRRQRESDSACAASISRGQVFFG